MMVSSGGDGGGGPLDECPGQLDVGSSSDKCPNQSYLILMLLAAMPLRKRQI